MSMSTAMHYHVGEPSPTAEARLTEFGPVVTLGGHPQTALFFLSTPTHARDLAAGLVAVARSLDAWADEIDPDPITAAAERLIATHETAAS